MTPFGLRKRFKTALGMVHPPAEIITYRVTFELPDGTVQDVHAEEGYNLLMASEQLPAPISTGRRAGGICPDGRCGLCRVEVLDGTGLSALGEREQTTMENFTEGTEYEGRNRDPGPPFNELTRQACHVRILGDGGRVRVPALVDFEAIRGSDDEEVAT